MGVANSTCSKCNEKFTAPGLRRHQKTCHGAREDFDCPECGMMFDSANGVKRHTEQEHTMEQAKSRVVCRHWRKGNCFKGDSCGFSHVGKQTPSEPSNTNKTSTRVPACSNGRSCEWLARGSCSYFHPRVGVQKPWVKNTGGRQETRSQGGRQQTGTEGGRRQAGAGGRRTQGGWQQTLPQGGRQQSGAQGGRQQRIIQPDRARCHFDGRCEKIPNCPFIHSMEDFPPLQARKNTVVGRNTNQKRT